MFPDRETAGAQLAEKLKEYKDNKDVAIIALPRGGVVVAKPVAEALDAPLDIRIVRKIGAPGHQEFAIGALAEPDIMVPNTEVNYDFEEPAVKQIIEAETAELKRRSETYRQGREPVPLKDKIVIIVDDGLATGTTMKAAIRGIKREEPKEIIVAVPVASPETAQEVGEMVHKSLILELPSNFMAVAQFYENFPQNTDEEVIQALHEA